MRIGSAHLMAGLALFVSLGGTGYAVTQLPKNSVGSAQLKRGSVTNEKLARGVAVTGPAGPRGPRGAEGPAGLRGPSAVDLQNPAVFRAHNADAQPYEKSGPSYQTVKLRVEDYDPSGVFDPGSSHFTAPRDGYYWFYATAVTQAPGPNANRFFVSLVAADPAKEIRGTDFAGTGPQQSHVSGLMRLERGQEVWVGVFRSEQVGLSIDNDGGRLTSFGGYFVSPL
ncbi:MAG: hypothetical protein PGN13_00085 [Patulibacter minatonensis]